MNLDDDARVNIRWDASLTFDPTGSTVELEVDGTRHAMSWQGSPVSAGGRWTQRALTNDRFCGSAATPIGSDVALTVGSHPAQPIVTTADGQVVPGTLSRIDSR